MITPFHKTGPFFHYWFTNMFHEFWQFDVSRVQVFYRIPQHGTMWHGISTGQHIPGKRPVLNWQFVRYKCLVL
jgi:hypothetical protein